MADDAPKVKHITATCPLTDCLSEAFVQVLVVEDAALQKKIDARANRKLAEALEKAHKEGEHD